MSESVLAFFALHGTPALMLVVLGAALALPLPASLLLITAGAFAGRGEGALLPLLAAGLVAAVCGDHAAYFLGRFASPFVVRRVGARRLRPARALMYRHGTSGVFLSRWLVPPLGPAVSYTAGIARLPLPRFFVADVLGAAIWVGGYVAIGHVFSIRLRSGLLIAQDAVWMALGGVMAVALLTRWWRRVRRERLASSEAPAQWEVLSTVQLPMADAHPGAAFGEQVRF